MKHLILALSAGFITVVSVAQTVQKATDDGSSVHFVIKNFGLKTGGDFKGLDATIAFDPGKLDASRMEATVKTSTIDTDNSSRDSHLKKSDFFDATNYPVIKIASSSFKYTNKKDTYQFNGNVTIKGITRPLSFFFTLAKKENGTLYSGEFQINRRDFGVGEDSMSMSDIVKVTLNILAR